MDENETLSHLSNLKVAKLLYHDIFDKFNRLSTKKIKYGVKLFWTGSQETGRLISLNYFNLHSI